MADLKKLYGMAASTSGVEQTQVRFDTFWLCFKSGRKISCPYRFVGPIEIDENEEHIVINCTCDTYQSINIEGERLSLLVKGLDAATVDIIRETPRPSFVSPGGMVVVKIEVVRNERC